MKREPLEPVTVYAGPLTAVLQLEGLLKAAGIDVSLNRLKMDERGRVTDEPTPQQHAEVELQVRRQDAGRAHPIVQRFTRQLSA